MESRFDVLAKVRAHGVRWREALQRLGSPSLGASEDEGFAFDALAKALAQGLPRREALRRLGGALAGAMLASLGLEKVAWAQDGGGRPGPKGCSSFEVKVCNVGVLSLYTLCIAACGTSGPGVVPCVVGCSVLAKEAFKDCATSKALCPEGTQCANDTCCPGFQTGCISAGGDRRACCEHDETCCDGMCWGPNQVCSNGGEAGFKCCPTGQFNSNGTCCPVGQSNIDGTCCLVGQSICNRTCVDLKTNRRNCGTCGNICFNGRECVGGECVCLPPEILCNDECVNIAKDRDNCGGCGKRFGCPEGMICRNGKCECPLTKSSCDGVCVDTASDPNNCGGCAGAGGRVCGSGQVCRSGACLCRTPGRTVVCGQTCCFDGQFCVDGQCRACPASQAICVCDGQVSCSSLTDRDNCGGCCHPCRDTTPDCRFSNFAGGFVCVPLCRSGQTLCTHVPDPYCSDLTDRNNCGSCGHSCGNGFGPACCDRVCTDIRTDPNNCGFCGTRCHPPNTRCVNGGCLP